MPTLTPYTTTAAVKKGAVAYLTPSGKVSPNPGHSSDGVFVKQYEPIGTFTKSAGKGKPVEVLMSQTAAFVQMNIPSTFDGLIQGKPLPTSWSWEDSDENDEEVAVVEDEAEADDEAVVFPSLKGDPKTDLAEVAGLKAQIAVLQSNLSFAKSQTAKAKDHSKHWQKQLLDLQVKQNQESVQNQGLLPSSGLPQSWKQWKKAAEALSPLKLAHVFRKAEKLSSAIKESLDGPLPFPCEPSEANLISSELLGSYGVHVPVLDIDMPCRLVPSSQPGHFHLYINMPLSWPDYVKLLTTLRDVGICQAGFVDASIARGFSSVRPPWVKKTAEEIAESKSD